MSLRLHRRSRRRVRRQGDRGAPVRHTDIHRLLAGLVNTWRLLAPILAPKVIRIGKNYAAHVAEMGGDAPEDPVIFIKPNTSIIGPEVPIVRPPVVAARRLRRRARRRHRSLQRCLLRQGGAA